jgi:hypothetical protein
MFRAPRKLHLRLPGPNGGQISEVVRGAIAIGLSAVAVLVLGTTSRTMLLAPPTEALVQTSAAYVPTSDSWTDQLTNPSAWRGGSFRIRQRPMTRAEEREERLREEREAQEARLRAEREAREEAMERAREFVRDGGGTYRTVCVRLCDGYFFPISFATTPDRFAADEATCNSRCSSSAKLYVYPNPGGEPEQMTDVRGQPYTALKNAFLFRTSYNEGCTCKPHPWDQASLNRHRAYAERAQGRKPSLTAKVQPERAAPSLAIGPAEAGQGTGIRTERPAGAMLVGVSERKPAQSTESQPKRDTRRDTGHAASARTTQWQNRAFSND